jgi:hypothetical protein
MYTFLTSPMHATCPTQHMLLDFITLMIFSGAYKLRKSSLYCLTQSPSTSSFLGQNILVCTLFSKHPQFMRILYCKG